jgi:U3 small nucleolar RNA-associated protein 10
MTKRVVSGMQPATAAVHADALFGFLQRAMDVRQQARAALTGAASVEKAAVSVLVTATMKLSEKQFKPLFLRLLSWASTAPAGHLGAALIIYRERISPIDVLAGFAY